MPASLESPLRESPTVEGGGLIFGQKPDIEKSGVMETLGVPEKYDDDTRLEETADTASETMADNNTTNIVSSNQPNLASLRADFARAEETVPEQSEAVESNTVVNMPDLHVGDLAEEDINKETDSVVDQAAPQLDSTEAIADGASVAEQSDVAGAPAVAEEVPMSMPETDSPVENGPAVLTIEPQQTGEANAPDIQNIDENAAPAEVEEKKEPIKIELERDQAVGDIEETMTEDSVSKTEEPVEITTVAATTEAPKKNPAEETQEETIQEKTIIEKAVPDKTPDSVEAVTADTQNTAGMEVIGNQPEEEEKARIAQEVGRTVVDGYGKYKGKAEPGIAREVSFEIGKLEDALNKATNGQERQKNEAGPEANLFKILETVLRSLYLRSVIREIVEKLSKEKGTNVNLKPFSQAEKTSDMELSQEELIKESLAVLTEIGLEENEKLRDFIVDVTERIRFLAFEEAHANESYQRYDLENGKLKDISRDELGRLMIELAGEEFQGRDFTPDEQTLIAHYQKKFNQYLKACDSFDLDVIAQESEIIAETAEKNNVKNIVTLVRAFLNYLTQMKDNKDKTARKYLENSLERMVA